MLTSPRFYVHVTSNGAVMVLDRWVCHRVIDEWDPATSRGGNYRTRLRLAKQRAAQLNRDAEQ